MKTLFWDSTQKFKNTDIRFFWGYTDIDKYLDNIIQYAKKNTVLDKQELEKIFDYYQQDKNKRPALILEHPLKKVPSQYNCLTISLFGLLGSFGIGFVIEVFLYNFIKMFAEPPSERIAESWLTEILRNGTLPPTEKERYENFFPEQHYAILSPFFICFTLLLIFYHHYSAKLNKNIQSIERENEKINEKNTNIRKENIEIETNSKKQVSKYEERINNLNLESKFFECSIDRDWLIHPTLTPSGHTYTLTNIEKWLMAQIQQQKTPTDPQTRQPCHVSELIPNTLLELIMRIVTDNPDSLSDEKKMVWLKTLLQDPFKEKGTLLTKPVIYPSGFTCNADSTKTLDGKDPFTAKSLELQRRNIALENILNALEIGWTPTSHITKKM